MQDYKIGELEVDREFSSNEWYDFFRDTLRQVGVKNEPTLFILSDAQILNEKFLEDINNLLNIGEIPNLYGVDDKEALMSDVKDQTDKERLQLSSL